MYKVPNKVSPKMVSSCHLIGCFAVAASCQVLGRFTDLHIYRFTDLQIYRFTDLQINSGSKVLQVPLAANAPPPHIAGQSPQNLPKLPECCRNVSKY